MTKVQLSLLILMSLVSTAVLPVFAGQELHLVGRVEPRIDVTIPLVDDTGRTGKMETGDRAAIHTNSPTRSPHTLIVMPYLDPGSRTPASSASIEVSSHTKTLAESTTIPLANLPHSPTGSYRVIVRAP